MSLCKGVKSTRYYRFHQLKGVHKIAQDLPAQKAPEKKRAWLQKKNENG
jgi:hypothetical protein